MTYSYRTRVNDVLVPCVPAYARLDESLERVVDAAGHQLEEDAHVTTWSDPRLSEVAHESLTLGRR